MVKRHRSEKRISQIAGDIVEHNISEDRKSEIRDTTDGDLFFTDLGDVTQLKKSKKVVPKQNEATKSVIPKSNAKPGPKFLVREEVEYVKYSEKELSKIERAAAKVERRVAIEKNRPAKPAKLEVISNGKTIANVRDVWADEKVSEGIFPRPSLSTKAPVVPKVVPSTGSSYNPDVDSHQLALKKAIEVEEKLDEEDRLIKEKLDRTLRVELDDFDPDDSDSEVHNTNAVEDEVILPGMEIPADFTDEPLKKLTKGQKKKLKLKGDAKRNADLAKFYVQLEQAKEDVESFELAVKENTEKNKIIRSRNTNNGVPKSKGIAIAKGVADVSDASTLAVPLSEELTGSLRTMKPVTTKSLLEDAIESLGGRGLVHKRSKKNAIVQVSRDGEVKVLTNHQMRKVKNIGNPWKELEFPRRKEFGPAERILNEERGISVRM